LGANCAGQYTASVQHMLRFRLITPDGEQHEFRQIEFDGKLTNETWQCDSDLQRQMEEGKRWRTHDGSQLDLAFDQGNAVVTMPGGTRILFPWQRQTNVTWPNCGTNTTVFPVFRSPFGYSTASAMIDRNGNQLTFNQALDDGSGNAGTITI